MSRVAFILFVVVGVLLSTSSGRPQEDHEHHEHHEHHECPQNQEWTSCGSACQPSCENPNPQVCTMQCVIGCRCKEGFLLNSVNECISSQSC